LVKMGLRPKSPGQPMPIGPRRKHKPRQKKSPAQLRAAAWLESQGVVLRTPRLEADGARPDYVGAFGVNTNASTVAVRV